MFIASAGSAASFVPRISPASGATSWLSPAQRFLSASCQAMCRWRDRRRDFLRRLATHSKPWRCGERSGACGGRRRLADWFGSGNGGRNEARRRRERIRPPTGALEPPHRAVTAFHAAVILLQPVIQILAVAMPNSFSPHRSDVSALLTAHSRGLSLNKRIRR